MTEENLAAPSRDEAQAALAAVDRTIADTRRIVAGSVAGPIIILWGGIWMAADLILQYRPEVIGQLWWAFDIVGIGGTWYLAVRCNPHVKTRGDWRFGAFWFILFGFGSLWVYLLVPWNLLQNASTVEIVAMIRRIEAFGHTLPMFAYVIGGLWMGRFFVWLGLLVTALTVAGYLWVPDYFYLWMAFTGGGSLIIGGLFIRKFWR
jgi:hypothetical protein